MGFSEKQVNALQRKLDGAYVHTREVQGRTLSYIEGWHAIAEANRIFGFGGWDRETVESKCVLDRENDGGFHAVYVAKVRITVRAAGETVLREGYGAGEAQGSSAGGTHEKALKTAETDATKRALATFGKPFGLALYVSPRNGRDRGVSNPLPGAQPIPDRDRRRTQQRVGRNGRYFVPARARVILDATLPTATHPEAIALAAEAPTPGHSEVLVPLPSTALQPNVDRQGVNAIRTQTQDDIGSPPLQPPAEGKSADASSDDPRLLIDWPKRRREPEHLKYVRTQPCLICSRTPSDAHHLRFAQSRGIGLKVSDEFTVPLCRVHHDQLHQSGKEIDWWSAMDREVDPLAIARGLWEETQNKLAADETRNGASANRSQPSK
jgi:DNA recombination protein Rad52